MCGSVQDCVLSDVKLFLADLWRIDLPILDRILQLIKALDSFIEGITSFNIRYEDLAQQIEVLQIQSLAVSRHNILDGQDIQWINFRHGGRYLSSIWPTEQESVQGL